MFRSIALEGLSAMTPSLLLQLAFLVSYFQQIVLSLPFDEISIDELLSLLLMSLIVKLSGLILLEILSS